jgi:quercetin dioxygenase-like cupin family protein
VNRRELLWTTIAASGAFGQILQAQDTDLDPLKVTPQTHKLLFENQFVRVIESKVPAGGVEPKHSHPHSVTVYLAESDAEIKTFPDGKTSRVHRAAGTAAWSEAIVHEIKNVGATSSHTIRVELKC